MAIQEIIVFLAIPEIWSLELFGMMPRGLMLSSRVNEKGFLDIYFHLIVLKCDVISFFLNTSILS